MNLSYSIVQGVCESLCTWPYALHNSRKVAAKHGAIAEGVDVEGLRCQ